MRRSKLLSITLFVSLIICSRDLVALGSIPTGWQRIDARGYFTFYLPRGMKLSSTVASTESAWGSTFSDDRISLYAEYSSWPSEYTAEYLAKQPEYTKRLTEVGGRKAKVESWRLSGRRDGNRYIAHLKIYGADGKMVARMTALCKRRPDVEIAKRIFGTVTFP
jgi:hypothetical protein